MFIDFKNKDALIKVADNDNINITTYDQTLATTTILWFKIAKKNSDTL